MKHLATLTAMFALVASSSLAAERHYIFSEKFWGTDLQVREDGSRFCSTGSTLKKPNDHFERLQLVTNGQDAMLRLHNSALDFDRGEILPIGLQVDSGPVVEYTFVSAGGGTLYAPSGPGFPDDLDAFRRGQRLRTVNLYSHEVVSEYSLAGSAVNTLHLGDCAKMIQIAGRDYSPGRWMTGYR